MGSLFLAVLFYFKNGEYMTGKNVQNIVEKKISLLREKREDILNMSPEDALDEILDYKENLPLVHSFPEQSLYMLMHEVGHQDFLPVLSMASKKQWEYIIDQEAWNKDEIDMDMATYWLGILHMANPARLADWLITDQENFLYYFLRNKIDVVVREHDEDPSPIIAAGFTTIDDVIYYKVETENEANEKEFPIETKGLVSDILARIADKSYPMFQTVIFSAAGVINAEHGEFLYRFRNSRLEEKGFLPFDEAIEVNAPVIIEKITKRSEYEKVDSNKVKTYFDNLGNINSKAVMNVFSVDNYFTDTDLFSTEFVSLCNQVIVAEKKVIRTRPELNLLVERVVATLKLGAQAIGGFDKVESKDFFINNVFEDYRLKDIFRAGNTKIRQLRDKALRWQKDSWLIKNSFKITFLGEKWLGVLGGLLVWPCVYYDNYSNASSNYRNFNSIQDVEKTDEELEKIIALDDLFALMELKEINAESATLGWENFILTLWARDWLHMEEGLFESIDINEFKKFYEWLFDGHTESKPISVNKKQDFLNWITTTASIEPDLLTTRLGRVFDTLFEILDLEFKYVKPENLDAKYITLFVVD